MQHKGEKRIWGGRNKTKKRVLVRKDEIQLAWSQPSPRKTPDNHAAACGNGSSAETDSENKHLSAFSRKIVSALGNKQHFTIWQEPAHTHLFTAPDLNCPNISTRLEVQNNHRVFPGRVPMCAITCTLPSHSPGNAGTQLESLARQQDPKTQGSLVEFRPRC